MISARRLLYRHLESFEVERGDLNQERESGLLGTKLATLARLRGLTQGEIASRCEISRISVNRFFTGKSELKAGDLIRLLEVLGIHLETEIDDKIESSINGAASDEFPVTRDLGVVMGSLDRPVQKTLLEQISWWGNLRRSRSNSRAIERIAQYLRGKGSPLDTA